MQSVSTGGNYKLFQGGLALTMDHAYTLSFYAKTDAPQTLLLHLYSDTCPNSRCMNDWHYRVTTDWTRFEVSFVSTGTGTAGLNLFAFAPGTVWIDDVSLREGDCGVYRRDFTHGTVLLNYTTAAQTVSLGGTYYRLTIPGSTEFDGSTVTSETSRSYTPPSAAAVAASRRMPK